MRRPAKTCSLELRQYDNSHWQWLAIWGKGVAWLFGRSQGHFRGWKEEKAREGFSPLFFIERGDVVSQNTRDFLILRFYWRKLSLSIDFIHFVYLSFFFLAEKVTYLKWMNWLLYVLHRRNWAADDHPRLKDFSVVLLWDYFLIVLRIKILNFSFA